MKMKNVWALATTFLLTINTTALVFAQVSDSRALKAAAPQISTPVAFGVSPTVRTLATVAKGSAQSSSIVREVRPERGPIVKSTRIVRDGALQQSMRPAVAASAIPNPSLTFEGLRNTDNPFLVAPPDPRGALGPTNTLESG